MWRKEHNKMWIKIKSYNIHIIGVTNREEAENGEKKFILRTNSVKFFNIYYRPRAM